ncbi:MAG: response regulator transcription factor [Chloroflexota bacterium]
MPQLHRILIADPDMATRNFLFKTFSDSAYELHCASDGKEALQHIRHGRVDLMLADTALPEINGVDLLHRARNYDSEMIVVLLAQQATVATAIAALRHGAFDYLMKPIVRKDIVAVVESGLDARRRALRSQQLEQFAVQMLTVMGTATYYRNRQSAHIQRHGELEINTGAFEAALNGDDLGLTLTEFRLLKALCDRPGVAVGYVKLVEQACGYSCSRDEAREIIGTHVRNLRAKINVKKCSRYYVTSVRGVGYMLDVPIDDGDEVCCA